MELNKLKFAVGDRFLKYVQIDTQSDPESNTYPTTEKQKDLSRILVKELEEMGATEVELDKFGYVYATIPANTKKKNVPVICFCSHVDTAPDCSGTNVKPIIHKKYTGKDIVLPDDKTIVISMNDFPELTCKLGHDIVTGSGLTLLGSDDKSGVAEIMEAAYQLLHNPTIQHGKIRILFTPDEEVGKGVDNVDMKKLGADFGYTLDGGEIGDLESETFSADAVVINIHGVSSHPGYAKGKMENAIKIVSDIVNKLPKKRMSPETTFKKQGFIHPTKITGQLEEAQVSFIIRDFDTKKLKNHEDLLESIVKKVMINYPNSTYDFKVIEQYRNMQVILDKYPQVVSHAKEAIKRTGLKVHMSSIRGGTDGSRLSFMGLPCPNLYAAEHGIHSKKEWVSIQDMEKAVQTIMHLCMVWEEKT
jgi:tripeptide aminopeptidase